jgi:hypothetical protein
LTSNISYFAYNVKNYYKNLKFIEIHFQRFDVKNFMIRFERKKYYKIPGAQYYNTGNVTELLRLKIPTFKFQNKNFQIQSNLDIVRLKGMKKFA